MSAAPDRRRRRRRRPAREQCRKRHVGIGRDRAEQRISVIDRLDLDQGRCVRRSLRAIAAQRGGDGNGAVGVEKARSLSLASRWTSEKARSPPRITRPAREMPSARLCATEPTPAMAMTPSAMQATKTPKPRKPPRSSRQAKRNASAHSPRPMRSRRAHVSCCLARLRRGSRVALNASATRDRSAPRARCRG